MLFVQRWTVSLGLRIRAPVIAEMAVLHYRLDLDHGIVIFDNM